MDKLKEIPTSELVAELLSREGVDWTDVEPYVNWNVQVGAGIESRGSGPVSILVIED